MAWVHDPDNRLRVGGDVKRPLSDNIYSYFQDVIKPGQRVVYIASGSNFRINIGTYLGVIRKPGTGINVQHKYQEYVIKLDDGSRTRIHYNNIFADTVQLSDLFGIQF